MNKPGFLCELSWDTEEKKIIRSQNRHILQSHQVLKYETNEQALIPKPTNVALSLSSLLQQR